jgi:hypothetical protein
MGEIPKVRNGVSPFRKARQANGASASFDWVAIRIETKGPSHSLRISGQTILPALTANMVPDPPIPFANKLLDRLVDETERIGVFYQCPYLGAVKTRRDLGFDL